MKKIQKLVSFFTKCLESELMEYNAESGDVDKTPFTKKITEKIINTSDIFQIKIHIHKYLNDVLESFNEKQWIAGCINDNSYDNLKNQAMDALNGIDYFGDASRNIFKDLLLKLIDKTFVEKMPLQFIRILYALKNRLSLESEIVVFHGDDLVENEKKIIVDKILEIDSMFSYVKILFRRDDLILQGIVIAVGMDLYDLSIRCVL